MSEKTKGERAKPRILAVDDERKIVDILRYFLEQAGYEVETHTRPDDALEAARKGPFDLVILDVVMEGTDGYTVAGRLKEIPSTAGLPILFASAKLEINRLFLKNFDGRADFVNKPFKKEDLLRKVQALLDGK